MLLIFNARWIVGVFILLMLSACGTPQMLALRNTPPAHLKQHVELTEVAYFPQDEYQCGPATLAMAFQSAGIIIEPGQLKGSLYIPDKQGSLQVEMLATTRRQGLLAYQLDPSLQDVLSEVAYGNPVVILQNLGLSWYPLWHYAVVIGYNLENEEIILRSGSHQRLVLPMNTFENTWARSNYWAMVALPVANMPQTARLENYIQSIAALEHSSPTTETWPAYEAAMQRWPDKLLSKIAAGNHAYSHGDFTGAEQIFLQATRSHPDSAAAFNNLAQTLSDQGKYDAALEAIQHALQIGGPLEPSLRLTLAEIEQKKRDSKK